MASQENIRIEPIDGWPNPDLAAVWRYRDLLSLLVVRDIKLRYKQTLLGVIWIIFQPFALALVLAVIFGLFANLPTQGTPYFLLAFCGLVPWNLLANAVLAASRSIVNDSRLVSRIYFPRLLIPLSACSLALVDFVVSLVAALVVMAFFGLFPTTRLLALPMVAALTLLSAVGLSFWFAALSAYYRDFILIVPFMLQVWMYLSPVLYDISLVPPRWRALFFLNPAVGCIEGFRWALLGSPNLDLQMIAVTGCISLLLFLSGAFLFTRLERGFADVV